MNFLNYTYKKAPPHDQSPFWSAPNRIRVKEEEDDLYIHYTYTKNEHLACVGYIWFGTATNHVWGGSSFTNNAQELSNTQQSDNISPPPPPYMGNVGGEGEIPLSSL